VIFAAVISVFLFSGQQRRAVPQQRQPAPPVRQQVTPLTPPKPKVVTPDPVLPVKEMPHLFFFPEDVVYEGSSRTAKLLGDPRTEGLYVTRTFIPKGTKGIPHTHPDSRTVVVLSGAYYYGIGEEFEESRLMAMPPGSFFTEPAGIPHFTWAKDGDVVIQTTAIGPSGTQILPDKKPADPNISNRLR
jgi:quercetin dioxygenase-like cupin family protein